MLQAWLKNINKNSLLWNLKTVSHSATSNYSTEFEFETKEYKSVHLDSEPSKTFTVTKEDALLYYRQMYTIRRSETAAGNLYKEKVVRGFCHIYSGQEAIAVGLKAAMRPDDSLITAYRCHGFCFLMGLPTTSILSEISGKSTGSGRGKGGSMHMYCKHFYGGNGIVGAQVPLGTGVAFANKYLGKKNVCVALYGDGAANQGQIHESYNMAKLWNLPVVYVCENNKYGMGTSADRASANTEYYTRGDLIPGIWVNGMEVLSVREVARLAFNECDAGRGPIIIEAETYRYTGHSMSDPGTTYRTRDEIDHVRKTRDPITGFRELIILKEVATEDEIKAIETEVRSMVEAATAKARTDPEPAVEELTHDVYSNADCFTNIRGIYPTQELAHKRGGVPTNS